MSDVLENTFRTLGLMLWPDEAEELMEILDINGDRVIECDELEVTASVIDPAAADPVFAARPSKKFHKNRSSLEICCPLSTDKKSVVTIETLGRKPCLLRQQLRDLESPRQKIYHLNEHRHVLVFLPADELNFDLVSLLNPVPCLGNLRDDLRVRSALPPPKSSRYAHTGGTDGSAPAGT